MKYFLITLFKYAACNKSNCYLILILKILSQLYLKWLF
jgi:hypothetical protein